MKDRILNFLRNEKILVISAVIALVTILFAPVDQSYFEYINLSVLCLLFSLMAVIAGFTSCKAFQYLASSLLKISKNGRILGIILVMLPFFSSMFVTNDVALITFVPFTILLLKEIHSEKSIIPMLVMQTVAANLGSMATPIGNPQNLFLYDKYEISIANFFHTMFPLTAFSFIALLIVSSFLLGKELPSFSIKETKIDMKAFIFYLILFILCLLTVFRILPYAFVTVIILLSLLLADRKILKQVDYALLLTFVCFFVISGNMGRIHSIQIFLGNLLEDNAILTGVLASQFISNVPAAILLSSFTEQWKELLISVNIGGLGTPIASLASLITLKLYVASEKSNSIQFLKIFTIVNVLSLAALICFSILLL